MMMQKGYVPYIDSFDHKGPLVYIINYIGELVFKENGVWLLEWISLTVTCFALYKTAKVFKVTCIQSIVAVFVSLSMLFCYFDGGNLVEEWAMPFIALSLYIFLDYIHNDKISNIRLLACGFSFGCVCMLRVNMVAVWCVFCTAIVLKCICEKRFAELLKYIGWFAIGVGICIAPIIIWLWIKGAISEFWFANIIFNMKYSNVSENVSNFVRRWKAFFTYANTPGYLLSILITCYLCIKKERFLYGTYILVLLLNLCSVSLSGALYPHYGMVLVPAVICPIAGLFSVFNERKESGQFATMLLVGFLVCNVFWNNWFPIMENFAVSFTERKTEHRDEDILTICDLIDHYSVEDDPISVYGNLAIIYISSNRPHATRFSYQTTLNMGNSGLKAEYWKELKDSKPKIIVVQKGRMDNDIQYFLAENKYVMVWAKDKKERKRLI